MALYNADLHPLEPGKGVRDYQHAKRLFLDDNYRLAPKQSFLYYVSINVDDNVINNLLGTGVSSQTLTDQFETGMLVKSIDLPKFSIDTKTLNAYNRKNINQNKINYDPVTITFHDDSADVVTTFWNDYYTYYYRDSDHASQFYRRDHKYVPRPYDQSRNDFGYSIRNQGLSAFLRNIQIFSLHGKRFTEYMLINPYITSWRHGEHRSSEGSSIMENTMTVAYEGVKYFTGWVNPIDVNGFALLHYDNETSPITNSTTNIYTSGGLLGAIDGASKDLSSSRRDNGPNGAGILSTVLSARRAIQNLKKANLGSIVNATLGQFGIGVIGGVINNTLNNIFVPTASIGGYNGAAINGSVNLPGLSGGYIGTPGFSYGAPNIYGSPQAYSGASSNGGLIGLTQGVATNLTGLLSTSVFKTSGPASNIVIGSQTGQPVAGQSEAMMIDPTTGEIIPGSTFTVPTAGNGGYVKTDPSVNLVTVITNTDTEGNTTRLYTYRNGDQVTFTTNDTGETVTSEKLSGASVAPVTSNPNSQVRTVTDPATGITRVVGNSTTAQVINSVTGTAGIAVGGYAGYQIGSGVSKALGGGIVGQVAGTAVGLAAGNIVGVTVNNGLQTIINSSTGFVSQAYDTVSGEIKNLAGQIFGSGAPISGDPGLNLVEKQMFDDGSSLSTYWDGSTITRDQTGSVIAQTTGDTPFSSSIGNGTGIPGYNQDLSMAGNSWYSSTDTNGFPVLQDGYGSILNDNLQGVNESQSFVNIGSFGSDIG